MFLSAFATYQRPLRFDTASAANIISLELCLIAFDSSSEVSTEIRLNVVAFGTRTAKYATKLSCIIARPPSVPAATVYTRSCNTAESLPLRASLLEPCSVPVSLLGPVTFTVTEFDEEPLSELEDMFKIQPIETDAEAKHNP
jgi:hypothetical protein